MWNYVKDKYCNIITGVGQQCEIFLSFAVYYNAPVKRKQTSIAVNNKQ